MLAATVFISLVRSFTQKSSINTRNFSDNQELIRQLILRSEYTTPFPNETTKGEFDLIEQIHLTSKESNVNASYGWVRGHQDRMKNDGDLSTEARLNIHCNFLAGKFQRIHGKFNPIVSILPSCPAQIQINGQSITSKIFQQLV